ncbi:hypothetical protein ID866_10332 [Astraeus odoratus]|nr:hypothetical protein ID866_10332 [Astraeus odoratus]
MTLRWLRRVKTSYEVEEVQLHFVMPPHLVEDNQDALGALTTMLDMLDMDFLTFQ